MHVNEDGTVVVATGSPDIGGSRASMAIMAAETLGIDYGQVRPIVADIASVGYAHLTGARRDPRARAKVEEGNRTAPAAGESLTAWGAARIIETPG
jgi:CO/xanthine dehydrogenase Mo-binding subunit